ncbi:hypothetical protein [Ancylobacter terrae]
MHDISFFVMGIVLGVLVAAWLAFQFGSGIAHPLHEELQDGP